MRTAHLHIKPNNMLFTLHRYIFRELLKVFLLAALALTLILSMGSILRPIQQYGAGPKQVLFLIFCFMPITLTFVLPMAALFAGSLVYGRFAADNELDACRASGVSILTLVCPGLLLAIVVAVANLFLSFQVMPRFVQLAETTLKADARQMLFRDIQKRGFFEVPTESRYQYLIYADQADLNNDTLSGVIVTRVKDNQIEQITTAESARVKFISDKNVNEVRITTNNAYQMDSQGVLSLGSLLITKQFGSLLGDDITFKRIDQMRQIRKDLFFFEPIALQAGDTFTQLATELLAAQIRSAISAGNTELSVVSAADSNSTGGFFELPGEPNYIRFAASQYSVKDKKIELSGNVSVTEYDSAGKRPQHTYSSTQAYLNIDTSQGRPSVVMDIRNARQADTNQLKMRHIVTGLRLPAGIETIAGKFVTETGSLNTEKLSGNLTSLAGFKPSGILMDLQKGLQKKIQKTILEIRAEIHSRLVFATGCIAMILIGIGLGIIRRDGHLLSAFGASCVPAAILVICIMSGKQLTKNLAAQTVSGVMLMWAGLAFLFLLAAMIYYRLMKN
jgi:lipopolysaccharide export LptBFGC system permease protein LptF